MGCIHEWPIAELKKEHNLEVAVESGTEKGSGTIHLASHNFKKVYTIELLEHVFNSNDFSHTPSIHALLGSSIDVLPNILKENHDVPTLFWLDGHLPSFYGHPRDEKTERPLKKELELIVKNKNASKDVIIIDDLRIYEDGSYANGNCARWAMPPEEEHGITFMYESFKETHLIVKDNRAEGYLIMEPLTPYSKRKNLLSCQELIK
jgi:hypothetical protein